MDYEPSQDVENAHNIPHLGSKFSVDTVDFSFSSTYLQTLLRFPLIIAAVCFLLSVCFCAFVSCSCFWQFSLRFLKCVGATNVCCNSCVIKPDKSIKKVRLAHSRVFRIFLFHLIIVFIFSFYVWYSNDELQNSFTHFISGINNISLFFNNIVNLVLSILNTAKSFLLAVNDSSTCGYFSQLSYINDTATTISTTSKTFNNHANAIKNTIATFHDTLISWKLWTLIIIAVFFVVVVVKILSYAVGIYLMRKRLFRLSLSTSWLLSLALFVLSSLEMIILVSKHYDR